MLKYYLISAIFSAHLSTYCDVALALSAFRPAVPPPPRWGANMLMLRRHNSMW